jgi:GDP-4-dehydro-6-deoxy-D-mannose reductase
MMEATTRRALVTGAAGFAGTVLTRFLRERGWEVRCTDQRAAEGQADWFACNVGDREQVEGMVAWAGPVTHVFHLAALTFVPEASHDPARAFAANLLGTVYLAEAVARHAASARFVYVSTSEVYGPPQSLPITESHPLNPSNPYAISKAAADLYCGYLTHTGLDVVRVRPFNHTGPGQTDRFVLSGFARQIARIEAGKTPAVLHVGNLDSSRDFTHVNDVVRAYETLALRGHSEEAYNVCSGCPVLIRNALDRLLALSSANIRVEPDPQRMRPVDVACAWGSYEKLAAHTAWRPEIPFEQLLADLLDYWRKRESP